MRQGNILKKHRFGSPKKWRLSLVCYAMLATPIIGFFVFNLYPILWAAHKSLFFYNNVASDTRYVGLENFIRLFTEDTTYWSTWLTTFKFALLKLPMELPLAMILAVMLHKKLKCTGFFRSVYFMPSIISVAIIGLIFSNMFDYFGFINGVLMKFGLIEKEIEWLANTNTAMLVLAIGSTWNSFGVNVLYFIAALNNVDEDLYESAYLDGASSWTIFWKITLPLIAPVLQVVLLLSLNGTLHTNDYILVTTNGAPGGSTYTVMSYVTGKFVPGFAGAGVNVGYGTSVALVTSAIMAFIALIYTKLSNKMNNLY